MARAAWFPGHWRGIPGRCAPTVSSCFLSHLWVFPDRFVSVSSPAVLPYYYDAILPWNAQLLVDSMRGFLCVWILLWGSAWSVPPALSGSRQAGSWLIFFTAWTYGPEVGCLLNFLLLMIFQCQEPCGRHNLEPLINDLWETDLWK